MRQEIEVISLSQFSALVERHSKTELMCGPGGGGGGGGGQGAVWAKKQGLLAVP